MEELRCLGGRARDCRPIGEGAEEGKTARGTSVERPTRSGLIDNFEKAKAFDLMVPQSVLVSGSHGVW